MNSARRGYTLLEMSITLAVMAVASMLVVPAIVNLGRIPPRRTANALISLLEASRQAAIAHNIAVSLVIDPVTGYYRVDSTGVYGTAELSEGQLDLNAMEMMVTDLPRLNYVFHPDGAAQGDTVRVRGTDSSLVVSVDPWNGVAHAAVR